MQVEFCQPEPSQTLLERKEHGTWCWLGAAQYTVEEAYSLTTWSTEGPKRKTESSISGSAKGYYGTKVGQLLHWGYCHWAGLSFPGSCLFWHFISIFKSLLRLHRVFIHWGRMIFLSGNHLCPVTRRWETLFCSLLFSCLLAAYMRH